MRRLNQERRAERGVTAVFIAMSMTLLISAVGLGVDTTSLRFERSKFQHAADASALAIGNDCAAGKPECASYQSTANTLTAANSSASTAGVSPSPVTQASRQARVTVSEAVPTRFFKAFGINNKQVTATSRVIWTDYATAALVLPFAASVCEYKTTKTPTYIETDINDLVKGLKKDKDKESTLGPGGGNLDLLRTCSRPADVPASEVPASSLGVMKGGLWIPKSDASNNYCDGKLHIDIFAVQTEIAGKNANCIANKWGPELAPLVGGEMLMAIYAPARNYSYGGVASAPAGLVGSGNAFIADENGRFLIKIIGFAPFHVTGFCFEGTSYCRGTTTGKDRIDGYFTGSVKKFEEIEYGSGGTNFGAVKVELVD